MKKGKSLEEIAAAIVTARGNMAAAARALGLTRKAVWYRVKESTRLQAIVEDAKETLVDDAEMGLFRAVDNGEEWAIKRVLDSKRGAARGWRADVRVNLEEKHTFAPDFDLLRAALSSGCGEDAAC